MREVAIWEVDMVCAEFMRKKAGQGTKQRAAASRVIIDLLLDTCYWKWKLESGEGTRTSGVQGSVCWLKLDPLQ